jgi:hypothetical protein
MALNFLITGLKLSKYINFFTSIVHIVQRNWVKLMNHAYRQRFYIGIELVQERNLSDVEYSPGCRYCDPGSRPWREPYLRTDSPWSEIVVRQEAIKEEQRKPGLPSKAALFFGPSGRKEKLCDPI